MSEPNAPRDPVVPFRLGGHVALDFVNTVDSWARPAAKDYIGSFEQLAEWAHEAGLIDLAALSLLLSLPAKAQRSAHREAIALRDLLERVFGSIIEPRTTPPLDLETLNAWLGEARGQQALRRSGGGFEWHWIGALSARSPALLVALAAAELLSRKDLSRLKRCPGPDGCGWMFLDESRNHSRRWCSMDFCGSAAKARRFSQSRRARS